MKVHIIEYGCIDFEQDSVVGIFATKEGALKEAARRAQEGVDDLVAGGESYVARSDEGGTSIFCNDVLVEWFRVETHDVED